MTQISPTLKKDISEIMQYIPHRYPFLLVDRILDFQEQSIQGLKNVSINEPYFQGHFPKNPIMPGVLIVEGMAQCAAVLALNQSADSKMFFFASMNQVKFRKPVIPGDQLIYEITILRFRGKICKFQGHSYVNKILVCQAEMTASLVDINK